MCVCVSMSVSWVCSEACCPVIINNYLPDFPDLLPGRWRSSGMGKSVWQCSTSIKRWQEKNTLCLLQKLFPLLLVRTCIVDVFLFFLLQFHTFVQIPLCDRIPGQARERVFANGNEVKE